MNCMKACLVVTLCYSSSIKCVLGYTHTGVICAMHNWLFSGRSSFMGKLNTGFFYCCVTILGRLINMFYMNSVAFNGSAIHLSYCSLCITGVSHTFYCNSIEEYRKARLNGNQNAFLKSISLYTFGT